MGPGVPVLDFGHAQGKRRGGEEDPKQAGDGPVTSWVGGRSASSVASVELRRTGAPVAALVGEGVDTRTALAHLMSVTILKIGRYSATTRPPMITPRMTIIAGSSSDMRAPTAVSTSSS